MIEERGTITALKTLPDGQTGIEVQTSVKTTCGSCSAKKSCSTSVIAEHFTPNSEALYFTTDQEVQVGQSVALGIRENTLLKASFMVYVLPLLSFISTFMMAQWALQYTVFDHELIHLLAALISTLGVLVWVSRQTKKKHNQYTPNLCYILPVQSTTQSQVIKVQTTLPKSQ